MQRRCCMDSCQVGFVALSMRVLNTTPGFQDSSNPHESSRTPSDPGVNAGESALNGAVIEVDECVAVSKLGTMRGATEFG